MSAFFWSCEGLNNGILRLVRWKVCSVNNKAFWNNCVVAERGPPICWQMFSFSLSLIITSNAQTEVIYITRGVFLKNNIKFKPKLYIYNTRCGGKCVTIHYYKTVDFAPFQNTLSRFYMLSCVALGTDIKETQKKQMLKRNLLCSMVLDLA